MNPDEHHDEAAIFEEVLSAKSQDEIDFALDRRCGNNTALRARIQALLKSYHQGEDLERFAANVFDDSLVGAHIGGSTPSNFDEIEDFDLAKLRNELLQETFDCCSQRIAACNPDEAPRIAASRATDTLNIGPSGSLH